MCGLLDIVCHLEWCWSINYPRCFSCQVLSNLCLFKASIFSRLLEGLHQLPSERVPRQVRVYISLEHGRETSYIASETPSLHVTGYDGLLNHTSPRVKFLDFFHHNFLSVFFPRQSFFSPCAQPSPPPGLLLVNWIFHLHASAHVEVISAAMTC